MNIINVHCHLLNFKFVPDTFLQTRAPIREALLRKSGLRFFARLLTALAPGKKYDRLDEVLKLLKRDIEKVAKALIEEMDKAGIAFAVPLMMDLETASFDDRPEFPYTFQIVLMSQLAMKRPDRMLPFVMCDPRREGAADLVIRCLEELGFLGVKMYPPLGYHPDPSTIHNEPRVNGELEKLYAYCEQNTVPITAHCSPGGAYSKDLMRGEKVRHEYTKPASWAGVLEKHPSLYLNLAHFGGDFVRIDKPSVDVGEGKEPPWSAGVRELIRAHGGCAPGRGEWMFEA